MDLPASTTNRSSADVALCTSTAVRSRETTGAGVTTVATPAPVSAKMQKLFRCQSSAFLNSNSFAASDVKLYLIFFSPNGLLGSTPKMVLDLGGFRSAAGPYW